MSTMIVAVGTLISLILCVQGNLLKPRFEYKYSFKGPHLTQSDNSVPFWEYGGDAIASADNIRLAPSIRSKKGWIWTKNPVGFNQWSFECVFKVTGRGRVGADGLAVWYTTGKSVDGPVFGNQDMWNGLGVFLDSFDNDGQHNNPYIMAMVNDGSKQFDHQSDGIQQQLGGCLRDFRNKPYPVRLKVEYYNKILTVFFNSGLTNNKDDFEMCLRQENVELPPNGYFGVSAATGGLADDHDVMAFLTHSLHTEGEQANLGQITDQDKQKYEKEFDEYYKELEQAKQEYQKQHPDKAPHEFDGMFESQDDRELRMIFDGQTEMHNTIKDLNRKLDELLGRQEMVLTRVSQLTGGNVQVQQGGQAPPMMIDTIKRHEVDRVLNNQNEIMQNAREIRQAVTDVQQRANIIQGSIGQGSGGSGGVPQPVQQVMYDLQENMRNVRGDVSNLVNRPQGGGGSCPPVTANCVSASLLFVGLAAQLVFIIGYMIYKQNKEAQAKKFY